jgi:exodeoxyribonuclease V alpha subunit
MRQETIQGVIEGIIFFNPENGYTVLTLEPDSPTASPVTVVGRMVELQEGETVRFTGTWTRHDTYGEQFKADTVHLVEEVEDPFGDMPANRKAIMSLQNYGITAALAQKVHDVYGDDAMRQITNDPYEVMSQVEGFEFSLAETIAQKVGVKPAIRLRGGVLHALSLLNRDGHIFAPRSLLVERTVALMGASMNAEPGAVEKAVAALIKDAVVVSFRHLPLANGDTVEAVYLRKNYIIEKRVAKRMVAISGAEKTRLTKAQSLDWEAFFAKLRKKEKIALTEQQQSAVQAALTNKISVLTGGPGTGKTTTLRTVIHALKQTKAKFALASPTGRAAKRLAEVTGMEARTVHRLLMFSPDEGFLFNPESPLDVDMVIVDEASMLDLELFDSLIGALPEGAHLMLVGDVDQLPSVGAGDVLRDVIRSEVAHVTRLDAIFRQADDSLIVYNAHQVNHGDMPDLDNSGTDFFMFAVNDGAAMDMIVDVVSNRIPKNFGLDPLNDVQVLAPMHKGDVGIYALNERLQAVLNPPGISKHTKDHRIGDKLFRVGDKVIQTRNNYAKDIFNGDIGRVAGIDADDSLLIVKFDDKLVEFKFSETYDLMHAFAISVHRSQGGEYPAVVMPIVPGQARMLQRNLLYTAITRARKLVVLVGSKRAVAMAVENNRVAQRYSGLVWQIEKLLNGTAG